MDKKKTSAKKKSAGKRPGSSPKAGGKKKKGIEQIVSKYPPIDFAKLKEIQEVSLSIRLDQARADSTTLDLKIPLTYTLRKVIEKINEKHNNSCHNIRIYLVENSSKNIWIYLCIKHSKNLGLNQETV